VNRVMETARGLFWPWPHRGASYMTRHLTASVCPRPVRPRPHRRSAGSLVMASWTMLSAARAAAAPSQLLPFTPEDGDGELSAVYRATVP
jgi:hypothetical protein